MAEMRNWGFLGGKTFFLLASIFHGGKVLAGFASSMEQKFAHFKPGRLSRKSIQGQNRTKLRVSRDKFLNVYLP